MYNFLLRQVYSFDVYPVSILGNSYQNVTVVGVLTPEQANKEIDIYALHAQVYGMLPAGTPNDPTGYDYVKIKFPSGDTTVLGLAWIKDDTVQQIQSSNITVVLSAVTPGDVSKIRNALIANGYNNFSIDVT